MLSIETKIELLDRLGNYLQSSEENWTSAKDGAVSANAWFTPEDVQRAADNIATQFLQKDKLQQWAAQYTLQQYPKTVGIVMAGNIPLVGFHDFLCGFISGNRVRLKLSSKDGVLLKHIISKLTEWEPEVSEIVNIEEMLKGCDAYIATGSNNTARYFEQYFARFPHLIRKNRTSVAILDGTERAEELVKLSDDIFSYFGLGCRNITQVYVPEGYDIASLLPYFDKYKHIIDHNKYKNNFDYYLAIYLLNQVPYLTNEAMLMVENPVPFSAVSVLHYQFYNSSNKGELARLLATKDDIQCIVSHDITPFSASQNPALNDYPDGVDTMAFLCGL